MHKLVFFVGLIIISLVKAKLNFDSDPDEYINTSGLIRSKGYVAEEHNVHTDDGYILTIHRIPHSRHEKKYSVGKPVVFLQHGLLDASSTWVVNFPEQSLGFLLADAGYDVWLGNMRGNTYGLRHEKLHANQSEFWNFSWDELAKHDLPSMISYVLKLTGQNSLVYVGHSQGTLIGFSEFGTNKNLASTIKLFIALGPVATIKHIISPVRYVAELGAPTNQQIWFNLFGEKDFLPSSKFMEWLADKFCSAEFTDRLLCMNILFAFCGPTKFLNQTRVPVYTTHAPAGTSVKNLAHYGQSVISGKFQMYDYGSKENLIQYNQTTPPQYDISKVRVPTALYWAKNDWLADPVDLEYIRKNLPNIVDDYEIMDWDHLDFVWAVNAKEHLYNRIIDLIKSS
ncbi:lysosomal acid lipase cholesteryl ester hydrolase-like [Brachionus plicatilis]|uniref:Lipase n=1 Tax=Brachionus plicatilis TaxID=10195 RepID=A0A3M7PDB1_BRAPC|nr:lysosomal acid lipase cholesteryl ester hydrolase-like [Brachionus plicatilis]